MTQFFSDSLLYRNLRTLYYSSHLFADELNGSNSVLLYTLSHFDVLTQN